MHGFACRICKTPQSKAEVPLCGVEPQAQVLKLSLRASTLSPYVKFWQRVRRGSKTSTSVFLRFTVIGHIITGHVTPRNMSYHHRLRDTPQHHRACDSLQRGFTLLVQNLLERPICHLPTEHAAVPATICSTSYIKQVVSLELAGYCLAQLRASCSSDSFPSLRTTADQACRHLSGVVNDIQPVPALNESSLEDFGPADWSIHLRRSNACHSLGGMPDPAMPPDHLCPSWCGQPQNTVNAERCCQALEGSRKTASVSYWLGPIILSRRCL